jgi:hypothetical protein
MKWYPYLSEALATRLDRAWFKTLEKSPSNPCMGLIKPLAWVCKETLASIPSGGLARVSFSLYLGSEK